MENLIFPESQICLQFHYTLQYLKSVDPELTISIYMQIKQNKTITNIFTLPMGSGVPTYSSPLYYTFTNREYKGKRKETPCSRIH